MFSDMFFNPFDGNNPLDNAMSIIEEYASKFDNYKIYYLGYSNGALIEHGLESIILK